MPYACRPAESVGTTQQHKTPCTGISLVDSTPLEVCNIHRIHQHRVFADTDTEGKAPPCHQQPWGDTGLLPNVGQYGCPNNKEIWHLTKTSMENYSATRDTCPRNYLKTSRKRALGSSSSRRKMPKAIHVYRRSSFHIKFHSTYVT